MPIINTTITETTNITENGQYDVAKYTTANVDVQPDLEELEVTPSTSSQTFIPTTDGYSSVSVDAVDSSIDSNITATNIKSGVNILGVSGSVVELNGETKTVTPTTSQQTITPTSGKNGITEVTVNAVTSSIDDNIIPENIKKDIIILGVTGTHEGGTTNPEEYMFVSFLNADSYPSKFIKKSEWENLLVGDELKIYDTAGNQITGDFRPMPGMTYTYTTPFIVQSKGTDGILDIATIQCANNTTANLRILKTENCYGVYSVEQIFGEKALIIAPLYPKVGDEVFQCTDLAPFQIEISSILVTKRVMPPSFSTSNPLMYLPAYPTSQQTLAAYGPITIQDVKVEAGYTSIILQDKDGNTLDNRWHLAKPQGSITITENKTDNYIPYYSNVYVDIPMPPATGGGYTPLAITDYQGNVYTRYFNTGSVKDFYAWQDEMGNIYYTCPLNNLSTLALGMDIYNDWSLQNSTGSMPVNVYGGGIRTENGTIAYISDLCEGELRIKNSEGIEIGFPEYKLPEVGEYAGPWGMVEEVYDSTIPMPIAIYGSSVGWLFFNRLDGDDFEPLMIFNNNHGMSYSVCGSKFYGTGHYSICDEMGWSQEDIIEQYSFLGIVVDGEKYVKVNTSPIGNAVEFTNGQDSVYLDANNMLDTGVGVFEDDSLSTQIGYVDEVLSSQ